MLTHSSSSGGVITADMRQAMRARPHLPEKSHQFASFVRRRVIGDGRVVRTIAAICATVAADPGTVMALLDDLRDSDHVSAELRIFPELVMPRGILVVVDIAVEDPTATPWAVSSEIYPDAGRFPSLVALRRCLNECRNFGIVTNRTGGGISSIPCFMSHKTGPDGRGNIA